MHLAHLYNRLFYKIVMLSEAYSKIRVAKIFESMPPLIIDIFPMSPLSIFDAMQLMLR